LSTAGNFTNTGSVSIAKGSTLTVTGTGNTYSQSGGQTTLDGNLAGINGGALFTGGTILAAGTIKGSVTAGTASGSAVTINVGDNAKAGLLSITGSYTQLATGNLTGLINGTTAGSGFSDLKVTGTAALAGAINFSVSATFQSHLTLGETFTVLTASSVSGTFSNSTISINSSFHFTVGYTATGVVLTVASGPVGASNSIPAESPAMASAKPAPTTTTATTVKSGLPVAVNGLRRGVSGAIKSTKPIMFASWAQPGERSNAIVARASEWVTSPRSWEHIPVVSASQIRPTAQATLSHPLAAVSTHVTLPTSKQVTGQSHVIGIQSPRSGWMGKFENRGVAVKTMSPILPRIGR